MVLKLFNIRIIINVTKVTNRYSNGGVEMASVFDVADYFLNKQNMTPKKLQKICYYAQAWSSVLLTREIIDEEFQAWVHGPVCPQLYSAYKDWGWHEITESTNPRYSKYKFSEEQEKLLDVVWNTYGEFDGDELELLTHHEDPWIVSRKDLKPYETCVTPIPVESMKSYYTTLFEKAQGE